MKKFLSDKGPSYARKLVQFRALKAMLKYKVRAEAHTRALIPRAHSLSLSRARRRCAKSTLSTSRRTA